MNEPVAYGMFVDGDFWDAIHPNEYHRIEGSYDTPLYTHPVKELTDEEICKIFNEHTGLGIHQKEADKADLLVFARAILRKASEK